MLGFAHLKKRLVIDEESRLLTVSDVLFIQGSALTELPIQGVTFGPEPDTQLKLVKGGDIVDLDARQKKLILKKTLDRDEVEAAKVFSIFFITYSLIF